MTDERRAERVHGIVYSCDGREELADRMVDLEELVSDLAGALADVVAGGGATPALADLEARVRRLGIEVAR